MCPPDKGGGRHCNDGGGSLGGRKERICTVGHLFLAGREDEAYQGGCRKVELFHDKIYYGCKLFGPDKDMRIHSSVEAAAEATPDEKRTIDHKGSELLA